jgi:Raf kinase inhibitor-like YbhB/YbcL family protein
MNLRHTARLAVLAVAGWGIVLAQAEAKDGIAVASPAFSDEGQIPPQYTKTHDNISPPLAIFKAVSGSGPSLLKSFVLIVDDPDAPMGLFTHWVLWNIPADTKSILEGQSPPGAVQGKNSFGDTHYDGPAPPNGKHRYFFHLYGLDTTLSLPAGSDRDALEAAMKGHVIATAPKFYGTFATGQ